MLTTVVRIGAEQAIDASSKGSQMEQELANKVIINAVKDVLSNAPETKTTLVKEVANRTKESRDKIIKVLDLHEGDSLPMKKYWKAARQGKNAISYTINVFPKPPEINFL